MQSDQSSASELIGRNWTAAHGAGGLHVSSVIQTGNYCIVITQVTTVID